MFLGAMAMSFSKNEDDLTQNPCETPYVHYVNAAKGWLQLGDVASALKELTYLDSSLKNHPDVLLLRWDIHAALGNWNEAYEIALALIKIIPEDVKSWFNRAEALRHIAGGCIGAAYETLLPGAKIFEENYLFHFWLARYACLAGKIREARHWLLRAGVLGSVKKIALEEPDLQPLREVMKTLD
jgi:tetratricopeptide (TPR) repeat protein